MARPPDLRRITEEEYPEDQRELISKLGVILNQFMQQTIDALNKKLNNQNLNRSIKSLTTKTIGGVPQGLILIKPDVNGSVLGMNVIDCVNNTDGLAPTGGIFISRTLFKGLIKVTNITGLQDNKEYTITVEIIGS